MGAFTKVIVAIFFIDLMIIMFGLASPNDGLITYFISNPQGIFSKQTLSILWSSLIGVERESDVGDDQSQNTGINWTKTFLVVGGLLLAGLSLVVKRDELIYGPALIFIMSSLGVYSIITNRLPYPFGDITTIILGIITFFVGLEWARGRD